MHIMRLNVRISFSGVVFSERRRWALLCLCYNKVRVVCDEAAMTDSTYSPVFQLSTTHLPTVVPTLPPSPLPSRTPYPTRMPTLSLKPSPCPTLEPSPLPFPAPTAVPVPLPTPLPVPAPSQVPFYWCAGMKCTTRILARIMLSCLVRSIDLSRDCRCLSRNRLLCQPHTQRRAPRQRHRCCLPRTQRFTWLLSAAVRAGR